MADTTPSPQEQMAARIDAMRSQLNNLNYNVRLSSMRDGVEDLDTRVNGLSPRIAEMRRKGYVFGKGLESQARGFVTQWRGVRPGVTQQIEQQGNTLESDLRPLSTQFSQIQARASNPAAIKNAVDRLEKDLDMFESRVRSMESSIRGMFNSLSDQVNTLNAELDKVEWALDQAAQACFKLLPTEGLVMAVKARYSRDEKLNNEDPEGILYLTDQRLIFEQKQEVATKKVLFITTEKKMVQELVLETPVERVDKVLASKKGLFGNQDHLAITFKSGAPVREGWFHLDGQDSSLWQGLIGQACSGEFDDERAVAIDKKVVEKVRSAPSQCPSCGAPVTQTVLRGMDSISCEYCSYVMRL